jgi:mediator of RNA polymerase II transcription subunit 8
VAKGRETAKMATPEGIAQLQGIWDELRAWTLGRIASYVRDEAGDVYTKEERDMGIENVRTGLRRDLEEDSDDDDDEEDDDGENQGGASQGQSGQQQPASGPELETILWFANRGDFDVPPSVEYERKVGGFRGLDGVRIPLEKTAP